MIELIGRQIILDDNKEIKEYYTESGIVRAFYKNYCIQSLTYIDDHLKNELCSEYFKFYNIPIDLNPSGTSYLVLGGGMFSYPKHYVSEFCDKKMDVIEIDEECVEIAERYFYLRELIEEFDPNKERLNIIIDDALKYIRNCSRRYDYILVDLFDGKMPVKDIYIEENLLILKKNLAPRGIIIVNYIVSNDNHQNYLDDLQKLVSIAKHYKIITHIHNYDFINNFGNLLIIVSDNEIVIPNKYDYIEINDLMICK